MHTLAKQKKRILIVDDEEFINFTLREGLEDLPDCEIVTTMDSREALHLFEQRPFDLLITDYKMPGMSGFELATQIKRRYPTTGIILITAYSEQLLQQQPSATTIIQHILEKPVRLSEIRAVALETLKQKMSSVPLPDRQIDVTGH